MKKYVFVLFAAALSFTFAACGSNANKKQEPAPAQSSASQVKENGATPANISDLLESYTGTFEGVIPCIDCNGIIPCSDCEGIDIKLTLNSDYTYSQTMTYIGQDYVFENNGKWEINESLDVITIGFENANNHIYYKIVNINALRMLDKNAKEISSSHSYDLTR